MKPEDHQDIIKQMASRLREHSVPYREGAWERFKEIEKKKPRHLVLWPYFSAAAILIAIVLFLKPEQQLPVMSELVELTIQKEKHNEGKSITGQGDTSIASNPTEKTLDITSPEGKRNNQVVLASATAVKKENLKTSQWKREVDGLTANPEEKSAYSNEEKVVGKSTVVDKNTIVEKVTAEPVLVSAVKKEEKKEPISFLAALSAMSEDESFIDNNEMNKKWSVGLEVSPTISSNNHVNMGGGIAFAYSVSPKISFSSGISYLQLGAERMPHTSSQMGSADMGLSSPNFPSDDLSVPQKGVYLGSGARIKSLNKIEANLMGLDIPLTIHYHVNKNFYASAGVSVFNVLNEERTNQYENQEVAVFYGGAENKTPEPVIRTFYSSEVATEKQYEGKGLSGFYNFSIGYSIPVSKKIGLSVEPFFKIPMNTFRDEDMNLSNGGIKISTRF